MKANEKVRRNVNQVHKDLTDMEKVKRQVANTKDKNCNMLQNNLIREIVDHNKTYHLTYLANQNKKHLPKVVNPTKQNK